MTDLTSVNLWPAAALANTPADLAHARAHVHTQSSIMPSALANTMTFARKPGP